MTFTNQTYSPTAFTLNTNAFNLSIGTLDDRDATQALTIQNTTSGSTSTITLNGGTNSVAPSASDLLYVASGGTLTIGGGTGTLNLALAASGNFDIAGTANISSAISGAFNITKTGVGTLTLSGANTYSGTTTVSQGTLNLNFAGSGAPTTNIISASSALTLGGVGGTLNVTGGSATGTGSNTQTFASLGLGAGSNFINYTAGTGGTPGVTITANASATSGSVSAAAHGTVQFGTNGTTTFTNNPSTAILLNNQNNPYATYGTDDWAATNASGQVIAATYTAASSAFTASVNNTVTGSFTASASITLSSLRFADSTGRTVTFNTNTLTAGGILVASTAGASALNGSGFVRSTRSASGSNYDFDVIQNSANDFTIGANVGNASSSNSDLLKAGTGRLILTNTGNGYTSGTYVTAGVLSISNNGNLGAAATGAGVVLNGGSLEATSTLTLDNAGANIRTVTVNAGGGGLFAASGQVLTVDGAVGGGGNLNIGGSFSANGGTVTDNGTVILSGANTYTGTTTVNQGTLTVSGGSAIVDTNAVVLANTAGVTLNLASNETIGSLNGGGATGGNVTLNANTLTTGGANTTDSFAGVISSTGGGLTKAGTGTFTLTGANTYSGSTSINGGILALGSSGAIGSTGSIGFFGGTLQYSSAFAGGANADISARIASGTSTSAVSIDTNGQTVTFATGLTSGQSGGLTKLGAGTLTLNAANTYTGATNMNAGTLTVTNSIGTSGAPTGAITLAAAGTVLNLNNATVYASSLTNNDSGGGSTVNMTGTSAVTLSGALTVNGNIGSSAGLVSLSGGTMTANSAAIGRSSTTTGYSNNAVLAGSTTEGLYINGAALNITTTLGIGTIAANASSATMRMDSGSVTVGGTTTINTANNAGRESLLDLNGGTFTSNDTAGAGISIGNGAIGDSGELLLRGTGTLNATTITLGSSTEASGTDNFVAIGGTAYIGSGGIVGLGASGSTAVHTVNFGNSTVATAPTIAASADWSSSVNITLTNSSSAAATTFRAADASNLAHNITLSGILSGTGGLTKTGTGMLTLSGTNTYTGATTINGGTLALDFNGASAPASNIVNGSSALVMSSGTLSVLAKSNTATSQTFNGLRLNSGGAAISVNPAASNPNAVVLNLGSLTRNTGSNVNFTLPGGGQNSTYGITTTTANTAGSILGGWATVGLNDWAVSGGNGTTAGNITALGSYFVYDNVSGWIGAGAGSTSNMTDSNGYDATYTNSITLNSLRFNASNGDSNIGVVSGQNLTLGSGGLLVTNNVGAKYQRIGFLNTSFTTGQGQGGLTRSGAGDLVIDQNNSGSGHLEIYSAVFGTGVNLVKSGVGFLDLKGLAASYSGSTTINAGTLQLSGGNNTLPAGTTVTMNGGTLTLNAVDQTVAGLNGSSGAVVDHAGSVTNTLTVNPTTGVTNTYAGVIQNSTGTLGLTKTGVGTQILSGANTYSGSTSVNAGTLIVNGSVSSTTGGVSVASGATLGGGSTATPGVIGGATTIASGGMITGGTNGTVGTLNLSAGLSINGTYVADVIAGTGSDTLSLTGTGTAGRLTLNTTTSVLSLAVQGTLSAAQYVLATYATLSGTFNSVTGIPAGYKVDYGTVTAGAITLDVIPEPGTWLGGFFLLGTVAYSQRRRLAGLMSKAKSA